MQIAYKPVWGSQQRWDLQIVKPTLVCEPADEKTALENGWLVYDDQWYLSRATRIDVSKYVSNKAWPSSLTWKIEDAYVDPDIITKIMADFAAKRGFSNRYDPLTDMDRTEWIVVRDDGAPVAFTKLHKYEGGLESAFTAWNYHKPKMSVGRLIVDVEVERAKQLGLTHLYIGPGYEQGSAYKARFPGFEWWTGTVWSTDAEEYVRLCARDESVENIDDLQEIYQSKD